MRLVILGAGKYGREIEDIARQTNQFEEIFFLDDHSKAEDVRGVCSDFPKFVNESTAFHVAFGNNELRAHWLTELMSCGAIVKSIIHPTAYISPTARIGVGAAILPKAVVNSYSVIKDGCMINTGAIVDHDTVIEPFTHICVGAIVKADNHIPALHKIEAGVVIERETFKGE